MLVQGLLLVLSFVILYLGAEFALSGAEKIGKALGISPLVVGLLIVGFGTSLPEFFVSHIACLEGKSEIALGNIVGSNVANLFLILGISTLITPIFFVKKDILIQFKLHFILTVLLLVVLLPAKLYAVSAIILATFFVIYLWYTFKKMEKGIVLKKEDKEKFNYINILKLVIGFILLFIGGKLLVTSGSKLGELLGISTFVISAVFVAFGTSFPELMTALVACYKKKDVNLITGNIIGSNIFNVAFVLSSVGIYDVQLKSSYLVEVTCLLLASIFLMVLSYRKAKVFRSFGGLFLCVYLGIVCYWVFFNKAVDL